MNEIESRHKRFSNIRNFGSNRPVSLNINLDLGTLDLMCKAVVTCNPQFKRSHLVNMGNLIGQLNPESYMNNQEKVERVNFIKKGLDARLNYNLSNKDMIIMHINGGLLDGSIVPDDFVGINNAELNWLNDMISEALKYSVIYSKVDNMLEICNRVKNAQYGSKGMAVAEFESAVNDIQNTFRRSRNETSTEGEFTLEDGGFENIIIDTYNSLSSPGRKLITGMQAINELVGGGFESGRVYVFLGLPGEGKSTILLNMFYQIKKYNKRIVTKDPTKKPCIVLLTMENLVSESIERIFSIVTGKDNILDYDVQDVIRILREDGELYLTDESPINTIIKFRPSNSIDTNELYNIVDDLEDKGFECVCFFQDYIGRIESVKRNQELRIKFGDIVDEFKVFAEVKGIPVITAGQLNRDAARHIDEAKGKNKSDLVRTLGRSNVSESSKILDNSDAVYVIAPEYCSSDQLYYLGVRNVKKRFKATDLEYAYLPYAHGEKMKLLEDVNGIPNFKRTLNNIPLATTQSQNVYTPTTNIKDLDFDMTFKKDEEIFSTRSFSDTASCCKPATNIRMLEFPMEFYNDVTGEWCSTI